MLAHALQASGFTVGLYTSPHILRFNERIRIDLEPIYDHGLYRQLEAVMPKAKACGASYFETATALALKYFSEQHVDIEILEAGVGARLDATNAVPADVALITPIALDHQAWLGESIREIAAEKAYVASGCSLALSAWQTPEVAEVLHDTSMDIEFAAPDAWQKELAAAGVHQRINAGLAYRACVRISESLLPELKLNMAQQGIAEAVIPGRLEQIRIGNAQVWLDAAHNRHAVEALLPVLSQLSDPFDAIIVRTREDRSLADTLDLLRPYTRKLIGHEDHDPDAWDSLRQAMADQPDGRFLVLGSFTTVAAILEQLQSKAGQHRS